MAPPHLRLWLRGAQLKWASGRAAAPACSGLAARLPPSHTLEAEEMDHHLQVLREKGLIPA